jgi:hypothetical protein
LDKFAKLDEEVSAHKLKLEALEEKHKLEWKLFDVRYSDRANSLLKEATSTDSNTDKVL